MKKPVRVIAGILALIVVAGLVYWQFNKKWIVRKAVESVVSNKSDSLYYIHYDSSAIDAPAGNASFYNVTLQSDSLQKQLENFDTASEASIYNVHIGEVSVRGADVPGLLANQRVEATSIRIIRPVIYVISSGKKKKTAFNRNDSIAVYEQLLGKFKSIKAGEVVIEDGQLHFTHKINSPYISLNGINLNIKNVLINRSKDYDNIVSYFIKDVVAKVKQAVIKNEVNNSTLTFSALEYDARQRIISLGNFQQKDNDSGKIVFNINNTFITGLNTDSFILRKQLKAEEFISGGGLLTFYRKKSKDTLNESIELDNNFFDEALLNKISLNNTSIVVYNRDKPKDPPFTLSNFKFNASDIQHLYSGTNIRNLIGRSNWNISADGFSFLTASKIYKISVGAFNIDKATGKMHINYFTVKPQLSEAAYVKTLKEQSDLYNVAINNINITGIDTRKLIADKVLVAEAVTIQPEIKISCDRTIPAYTGSKVGNYPHQLLQKIKFPFYIKNVLVKDCNVSYTERSALTSKEGTVFFNKAKGTIENVTNMPAYIHKDNILRLTAEAYLMGVSKLQTKWQLQLDSKNGAFIISGSGSAFNASILNPLIEPLALASITSGRINGLEFNMNGNDNGAKGTSTLLYNDLAVEALKKDSNELKKRGLLSFVANVLIKDDNPKNGRVRNADINIDRDKTRSFFNLIWKGIFKAAKRIALGKDDN